MTSAIQCFLLLSYMYHSQGKDDNTMKDELTQLSINQNGSFTDGMGLRFTRIVTTTAIGIEQAQEPDLVTNDDHMTETETKHPATEKHAGLDITGSGSSSLGHGSITEDFKSTTSVNLIKPKKYGIQNGGKRDNGVSDQNTDRNVHISRQMLGPNSPIQHRSRTSVSHAGEFFQSPVEVAPETHLQGGNQGEPLSPLHVILLVIACSGALILLTINFAGVFCCKGYFRRTGGFTPAILDDFFLSLPDRSRGTRRFSIPGFSRDEVSITIDRTIAHARAHVRTHQPIEIKIHAPSFRGRSKSLGTVSQVHYC